MSNPRRRYHYAPTRLPHRRRLTACGEWCLGHSYDTDLAAFRARPPYEKCPVCRTLTELRR